MNATTVAPLIIVFTSALFAQDFPIRYRFEGGSGTEIIDSESGDVHGQFLDGVDFSPDAPCLASGEPNNFCADFTGDGCGRISAVTFPFHDPAAGGVTGDATVEWLMKVPPQDHKSIFWTNNDTNENDNRLNIFWNANFTGLPPIRSALSPATSPTVP